MSSEYLRVLLVFVKIFVLLIFRIFKFIVWCSNAGVNRLQKACGIPDTLRDTFPNSCGIPDTVLRDTLGYPQGPHKVLRDTSLRDTFLRDTGYTRILLRDTFPKLAGYRIHPDTLAGYLPKVCGIPDTCGIPSSG